MKLSRLSRIFHPHKYIVITFSVILIYGYVIVFLLTPAVLKLLDKMDRISAADDRNKETQRLALSGESIQARIQSYKSYLRSVLADSIADTSLAGVLSPLDAAAREVQLTITSMAVKPPVKAGNRLEWPITINAEGSYHQLSMFIDVVGRKGGKVKVESLSMKAMNMKQGNLSISIELLRYYFSAYEDLL